MQKACNDIFTVARLNFFSYVAGFFKPFLKSYQSNSPMIPYLYTDLSELVKKILQLFIRADVINANLKDFRRIEMKNENFLKMSSIRLGFACESSLAKIKNKAEATDSEIKKFKKQCQEVLLTTIGKLFERCPLGSVVVRSATCFDPIKIVSETTERNEKKLKVLLHHLLRLNILSTVVCDKAESDLRKEFVPKNQNLFEGFSRASTRLDHFYFNSEKIRLKIPNELGKVSKLIFTLSHGQAEVERGFSHNKSITKENMSATSFVSKRLIRDHMIANSLLPHSIEINAVMLQHVRGARMKYSLYLEDQKKDTQKEKDNSQLQILLSEEAELITKKEVIKNAQRKLDDEYFKSVALAEGKSNLVSITALIKKANALKRKSDEQREELDKLDKALQCVSDKKRKINH